MTLHVVTMSQETIKPSLPTPQHLKDYKLSQVDQLMAPLHVPLLLFFSAKRDDEKFDNQKAFDHLKRSLSETLTCFYPLGGRINDNHLVQCNDDGVEYLETQVSGELYGVVSNPKHEDLLQLLPCDINTAAMGLAPLLAIQINKFKCGGIAIAICGSHKTVDAATLCTFVNSWAKAAFGSSEKIVLPSFDAATIFPPKQIESVVLPTGGPINKVVSKRFVFDSQKISFLKAKAANSYIENPTRVEVIMALLWKCALNVTKERVGFLKPSLVNLSVNCRGLVTPPLADHSFGNLVMNTVTPLTSADDTDLRCFVGKLREAKRKLGEDHLKKLPVNDALQLGYASMQEAFVQQAKGEVEFYLCTSWCRFPIYETDFGWGKPMWAYCNFHLKNVVTLMDTRSGDGVEAWVCLDEQDMMRFECDEEILNYASLGL